MQKKKMNYGLLLKRKRNEKKYTQEELAKKICSYSYLSKIENDLIDVDEKYYKTLYERVNIDFFELKEKRNYNLYEQLILFNLKGEYQELEKFISEITTSNYYAKIELLLSVLYFNLCKGLYDEARSILEEISNDVESLAKDELSFYFYNFTLYAYSTNQLYLARKNHLILEQLVINDTLLIYLADDLATSIYFKLNNLIKTARYFDKLIKSPFSSLFPKISVIHQLRLVGLEFIYEPGKLIEFLNDFKLRINLNDPMIKEEFYYAYIKALYFSEQYEKIINLLEEHYQTPKITILLIATLSKNQKEVVQLVNRALNYQYADFDISYQRYIEYINLKYIGCNFQKCFSMLKNIITNPNFYLVDPFFQKVVIDEFLEFGYNHSKYKETIKVLQKYLKEKTI